ncbi:MAG: NACHT domain-containing protein [Nodosilinea sp.]
MTGFEPLIGAAAAGLGGLITNLVKDKGTETLKKIDWDIGKDMALRKAMVDYVRRYIDRHGTLKVACVRMDYPMRLDEIYTAVQLLDRSALRYFESEDALQTQYRESGKRGFNVTNTEKKPGLQVANKQQYLMVLGGPGVGKSTFLRKVGLEALRTLGRRDFAGKDPGNLLVPQGIYYEHPCIPLMLELRQFDKADVSIQAVIATELGTCGFPHPEELTELFLKNGKLLVLLDGLDEVPAATLDHVLKEIRGLVDRYSDNRYIASCRVAAYTFGGFTRFKDVAMAAFEDEQIEQFIKNWFQKERDTEINTAERCWKLLNSPDYQAAKELAQTPLLLTLLCVVYDEFQDFPKKRHALYGEALDVLLRKWASEKRIQRNPIYQELSAELEIDMLAEIAYTSFVDNQLFFSKDRLINQIREFLIDNLNAPSHLDAETVLKEIEIQQGILVERARDAYSFSHLTFQEYLTAKCIIDNNKMDQLVRTHATEKHWREVFLLVAGLSPGRSGADTLLLALERQAQTYLSSPKLKALLAWATTATEGSPGNSTAAAKRTAAVFLARARDRDRDIDIDLALVEEFQKLGVFKSVEIGELIIALNSLKVSVPGKNFSREKIYNCFSKNLKFDTLNLELSNNESQQLIDYLYTLELIVRCKEAAVRVSPQVWAGIESRMVTVPTE